MGGRGRGRSLVEEEEEEEASTAAFPACKCAKERMLGRVGVPKESNFFKRRVPLSEEVCGGGGGGGGGAKGGESETPDGMG